jgi:hypothetical protein
MQWDTIEEFQVSRKKTEQLKKLKSQVRGEYRKPSYKQASRKACFIYLFLVLALNSGLCCIC